jgi:type VI protein secretion system component VasF
VAAVVGIAFASRVKSFRRSRTEKELDQIVQRLGGRLDRLKGRARKRFRETLKSEIEEVETGPRATQMIWESATAALTAAATLFVRRFVSRLSGDEDLPDSQA